MNSSSFSFSCSVSGRGFLLRRVKSMSMSAAMAGRCSNRCRSCARGEQREEALEGGRGMIVGQAQERAAGTQGGWWTGGQVRRRKQRLFLRKS